MRMALKLLTSSIILLQPQRVSAAGCADGSAPEGPEPMAGVVS